MSKIAFFEKGKKGDGPAFANRVRAAEKKGFSVPSKDNSQNSGGKQSVGR